jgi:hypothetical protein
MGIDSANNLMLHYCRIHALEPPTDVDQVCAYLVWLAEHDYKVSAIGKAISAMKRANTESAWSQIIASEKYYLVKRSVTAKALSLGTKRAQEFTMHDVETLVKNLHMYDYRDILFLTIIIIGICGLHRLGELVDNDNPNRVIKERRIQRSSLRFEHGLMHYTLPYSKTSKAPANVSVSLEMMPAGTMANKIVRHYLLMRDKEFGTNGDLFIDEMNLTPTRAWAIDRIKRSAGRQFSGHSLRAAGATTMALARASEMQIMTQGRWTSSAWQSYLRKHSELLLIMTTLQKP